MLTEVKVNNSTNPVRNVPVKRPKQCFHPKLFSKPKSHARRVGLKFTNNNGMFYQKKVRVTVAIERKNELLLSTSLCYYFFSKSRNFFFFYQSRRFKVFLTIKYNDVIFHGRLSCVVSFVPTRHREFWNLICMPCSPFGANDTVTSASICTKAIYAMINTGFLGCRRKTSFGGGRSLIATTIVWL